MLLKLKALGSGFAFATDESGGGGSTSGAEGAGGVSQPEAKQPESPQGADQDGTDNKPSESDTEGDDFPDWAKDPARATDVGRQAREEAKASRLAKDQAEQELRALKEQILKDKEDYKTLYEQSLAELETLKSQAEMMKRYEEQVRSMLDARLKEVPDYLAPLLADKDPLEALSYINANAEKFKKPSQPDLDPGKRGQEKPPAYVGSDDHRKDVAKRFRMKTPR